MPAAAVVHQFLAHLPSGALDECGEKSVHAGKIGQFTKRVRAHQLPATACVGCIIAQHEAADAIGDARLQPFEATVIAAVALAGDEAELSSVSRRDDVGPEAFRIGYVILAIAVDELCPAS